MLTKDTKSYDGSDKTRKKLQETLINSTLNALLANKIPMSIAQKLSKQVANNIDFSSIYETVTHDIQEHHYPKQRVLDRTIVHMFEILYQLIYSQKQSHNNVNKQEFYTIVPRGECLDIFLKLIKDNCMGDSETKHYTYQIGSIIEVHKINNQIYWDALYQCAEFKNYLTELLNLILTHLRETQKPIPALENKIPIHYQPHRINAFLNKICKLKEAGLINLDSSAYNI